MIFLSILSILNIDSSLLISLKRVFIKAWYFKKFLKRTDIFVVVIIKKVIKKIFKKVHTVLFRQVVKKIISIIIIMTKFYKITFFKRRVSNMFWKRDCMRVWNRVCIIVWNRIWNRVPNKPAKVINIGEKIIERPLKRRSRVNNMMVRYIGVMNMRINRVCMRVCIQDNRVCMRACIRVKGDCMRVYNGDCIRDYKRVYNGDYKRDFNRGYKRVINWICTEVNKIWKLSKLIFKFNMKGI